VLRYKAALDQFPVFGREGYVLPLGRAVQHTGEIDEAKPVEQLWVFGTPAAAYESGQVRVEPGRSGGAALRVASDVQLHWFGDEVPVERL
jgi:hypothetical protein